MLCDLDSWQGPTMIAMSFFEVFCTTKDPWACTEVTEAGAQPSKMKTM